jgi:hypothetical protein
MQKRIDVGRKGMDARKNEICEGNLLKKFSNPISKAPTVTAAFVYNFIIIFCASSKYIQSCSKLMHTHTHTT